MLTKQTETLSCGSMTQNQNQIVVLEMPWNRLHREIQSLEVDAKNKAAQIGEMLTREKKKAGHGNWIKWVEDNCDFTRQHADNYIKVFQAKCKTRLTFDQCTSIRQVLELGKPKKEKPQGKKPKLDKDDRRKINKMRRILDDPATPDAVKESVQAKLDGYKQAHGKHFDDYVADQKQQEENESRPYVDSEYVAREMAKVVLDEQYNYDWRLAQIQDWIEQAFQDDDELMKEFDFIMENKGESHD